jgi:hypothetical protein
MAPRRSGCAARGPPSWWMSSTCVKTRRISIRLMVILFSNYYTNSDSARHSCGRGRLAARARGSPLTALTCQERGKHLPVPLQRARHRQAALKCLACTRSAGRGGTSTVTRNGGPGRCCRAPRRRAGAQSVSAGDPRRPRSQSPVAAASAPAASAASTVTLSAMPSDRLRPRQPLVATPRTGSRRCRVRICRIHVDRGGAYFTRIQCARGRHTRPTPCRSAGHQVQGDVAAVVDPGAFDARAL